MVTLIRAAAAAVLLLAWLPVAAHAQDGSIDLAPLLDPAIEILGAVLMVAALWLVKVLRDKLRIDQDEKLQGAIYRALDGARTYAADKARQALADKTRVGVGNPYVEAGAEYLLAQLPDTVQRLGLTRVQLERLFAAKVGVNLPPVDQPARPAASPAFENGQPRPAQS